MGALAALVLALGCRRSAPASPPARIVLLTLDTLRLDYLGAYDASSGQTPTLDRLAAEGLTFESVYSPVALTLPAHSSLLTGLSPLTTGVLVNGDLLQNDRTTLAELLRDEGYRTGAFVSLGVLKAKFGLDQGFDTYDSDLTGLGRWYRRADEVVLAAERWVEEHRRGKFFLWAHLSDPHEPYASRQAPADTELRLDERLLGRWTLAAAEEIRATFDLPPGEHRLEWRSLLEEAERPRSALRLTAIDLSAIDELTTSPVDGTDEILLRPTFEMTIHNPGATRRGVEIGFRGHIREPDVKTALREYGREVRYMDEWIAHLVAFFDEHGLTEDTLWLVISDHGEGLFRHGVLGHETQVFDEQLRVAWLMKGPGIPAGRRVSDVVARLEDVAPTIVEHLRLEGFEDSDGRSLTACWASDLRCPSSEPFWTYGADSSGNLQALAGISWPHKWIWRRQRRERAYELQTDPHEALNLLRTASDTPPEIVELQGEQQRWRRRFERALEQRSKATVSSEERRMLESLGYL